MDEGEEFFEGLTLLRISKTVFPDIPLASTLEVFANRDAGRDYEITFLCPEFTSLCPVTGQPDFGEIELRYVPDKTCVESKSLKIYLYSFRSHQAFHEETVNRVLTDVVAACAPKWAEVTGRFRPRGGISINVRASTRSLLPAKEAEGFL